MTTSEAIAKRIEEICEEKGKNICKVCLNGGKSPSALYDLMKGRTKCPKVTTIKSFCEGQVLLCQSSLIEIILII